MDIMKSTRHKKIIGDYGERLVCNWFSRSGFEVSFVDHTGIDVIAYNRSTNERLGISVKARTRDIGKEKDYVGIFRRGKNKNDRQKLLDACIAFACEPWIAVYVETSDFGDLYLTNLGNFDKRYGGTDWKMGEKHRELYDKDPNIKHIRFEFHTTSWWSKDQVISP